MMTAHIDRVFIPESDVTGDVESLDCASMDDSTQMLGEPDEYECQGYLVPANQLMQYGVPELVASPANMIIGLSTHERASLIRRDDDIWELLLTTGRGTPEQYLFRGKPEPKPAPTVRRRQPVW